MKNWIFALCLLVLAGLLAGCGGGGGGDLDGGSDGGDGGSSNWDQLVWNQDDWS